jgi:isopentenyl diphosphate isomerase/L-lactate dehydrogenase-like FMN-dependent dehydrogenase
MDDNTAIKSSLGAGAAGPAEKIKLRRRYPTIAYLRRRARRHVPGFAFEYMDGGAGADGGIARNWRALDAVELIPRYGRTTELPAVGIELFGRPYAAPIGIAPMGGPAIVWPGADRYLAEAAQRARIPYTLGTVGGMTIEAAAEIAPDVLWFQLYRLPDDGHRVGFDLVRRAHEAGVHVLMLTLDVPVRTTRPREVASGITTPFRPDLAMALAIAASPGWLMSLWRNGNPRFSNLLPYVDKSTGRIGAGQTASLAEAAMFARNSIRGAFTWEEVARYRDRWKRPLVVKGILHPEDAEKAVSLGVDGLVVSNHGGRQIEALPAAIDALPAIAAQVGGRATVLMDSGIRSGVDVGRALALGAAAAFAGKAFLWSLGALGEAGPGHVIDLLIDELKATLGQVGATIATARTVEVRHPGALGFGSSNASP